MYSKYSGTGGKVSPKSFKQDAKEIYNRMVRDPREHMLVGFGQWDFLTQLGSWSLGEARTVHVSFMDTWDIDNPSNPAIAEAQDVRTQE